MIPSEMIRKARHRAIQRCSIWDNWEWIRKSYCSRQGCGRNPLQTGRRLGPNANILALLFEVLPVAENTGDLPPIRTPRTRRSFRGLPRGGLLITRDFFHHALIGAVGKIHKYNLRNVQPYTPALSQDWERGRLWRIYPPSRVSETTLTFKF